LKIVINRFQSLSLKTRLTLYYSLFFAAFFLISLASVHRAFSDILKKEFDDALFNYAVDIAEKVFIDADGFVAINNKNIDKEKIFPFALGDAFVQVRHINGDLLSVVGNVEDTVINFSNFAPLEAGQDSTYAYVKIPTDPDTEYRLINFSLDGPPKTQLVLQIAAPTTYLTKQMNKRFQVILTVFLLLLLLSSFLVWTLVRKSLQPVKEIIDNFQSINSQNLSMNLRLPRAKDELWLLTKTLNEAVSKLKTSFEAQERFVSDASHQLLTPLNIIKQDLDLHKKELNNYDLNHINSAIDELDHLIKLTKDLLFLAQANSESYKNLFEHVSLLDIITDSVLRAQKVAASKKIKIESVNFETADDLKISGDYDLLVQLFFNLLENAVKYSPQNSLINVSFSYSNQDLQIQIQDEGPGFKDNPQNLFKRFYRSDTSSKHTGYGLGLSIAYKISELHGFQLFAENRSDKSGAVFSIRINKI